MLPNQSLGKSQFLQMSLGDLSSFYPLEQRLPLWIQLKVRQCMAHLSGYLTTFKFSKPNKYCALQKSKFSKNILYTVCTLNLNNLTSFVVVPPIEWRSRFIWWHVNYFVSNSYPNRPITFGDVMFLLSVCLCTLSQENWVDQTAFVFKLVKHVG